MSKISYNSNIYAKKGLNAVSICDDISLFIQQGSAKNVRELIQKALDEGISAKDIMEKGLLDGMSILGDKFRKNEVYVPEVLISSRAMNIGIEMLKPHLKGSGESFREKVIIGTVKGDLHDIGKNIVKIMLESKGFDVVDLGVDVKVDEFIDTAIEQNIKIVCASALLTTTMVAIRDIISYAEERGVRDRIKLIIGGAPITQKFCDMVGADAYGTDAETTAKLAVELSEE